MGLGEFLGQFLLRGCLSAAGEDLEGRDRECGAEAG